MDASRRRARGQTWVVAQTAELTDGEHFVNYTLWWHVHDYDRRNLVRAEVLGGSCRTQGGPFAN